MIEIAQRDDDSTLGVWVAMINHTWHSQAVSLKNFIAMTLIPYLKAVLYFSFHDYFDMRHSHRFSRPDKDPNCPEN